MSLIHDIQAAAISDTTDVPSLLRKCKLLAARISHDQFSQWVDMELNGYPTRDFLPDYRIVRVDSYGSFYGPFARANKMQIPVSVLPDDLQDIYRYAYLDSSISVYTSFLQGDQTGTLQQSWPLFLAVHHASKIMRDMQCVSAWKEIPIAAIARLADSVKTRILGFAIDLEREAPNAGDTPIGSNPPLSREQMTQIFNTNISGNVGNISNSGENYSQTATNIIDCGNWNSLSNRLMEFGLQPTDFEGLRTEAEQAKDEQQTKDIAADWIGRLTSKAISGVAGVGVETVATGIAKAIANYLGLPVS